MLLFFQMSMILPASMKKTENRIRITATGHGSIFSTMNASTKTCLCGNGFPSRENNPCDFSIDFSAEKPVKGYRL